MSYLEYCIGLFLITLAEYTIALCGVALFCINLFQAVGLLNQLPMWAMVGAWIYMGFAFFGVLCIKEDYRERM